MGLWAGWVNVTPPWGFPLPQTPPILLLLMGRGVETDHIRLFLSCSSQLQAWSNYCYTHSYSRWKSKVAFFKNKSHLLKTSGGASRGFTALLVFLAACRPLFSFTFFFTFFINNKSLKHSSADILTLCDITRLMVMKFFSSSPLKQCCDCSVLYILRVIIWCQSCPL